MVYGLNFLRPFRMFVIVQAALQRQQFALPWERERYSELCRDLSDLVSNDREVQSA
jgi:hypothetical protein